MTTIPATLQKIQEICGTMYEINDCNPGEVAGKALKSILDKDRRAALEEIAKACANVEVDGNRIGDMAKLALGCRESLASKMKNRLVVLLGGVTAECHAMEVKLWSHHSDSMEDLAEKAGAIRIVRDSLVGERDIAIPVVVRSGRVHDVTFRIPRGVETAVYLRPDTSEAEISNVTVRQY